VVEKLSHPIRNEITDSRLKTLLESFVRAKTSENVRVENLKKITGGASKEIWALDIVFPGKSSSEPLILRVNRASPLPISIGLREEFNVVEAAYHESVPVPKPFWFGDESLGTPFYLMARVTGETIVSRLLRDSSYTTTREVMVSQLARILAKIHRIDINKHNLSSLPHQIKDGSPALGELEFYETAFRRYAPEPHPAIELGLRWLWLNAPPCDQDVFVHGDFRLGNVIFGPEGVRAILDWELAHLGDPMEDLAWISVRAWRFGNNVKPVGGIGEREDFYQAYLDAGGYQLDRTRIKYWEVFGNLKWAIICILQANPFLEGKSDSVELASLGRKICENEIELLNLIEGC